MSNKQIVQDLLERIPEAASLHEIAREIEMNGGVGLKAGCIFALLKFFLAEDGAEQ